jgi:hypothetical protein
VDADRGAEDVKVGGRLWLWSRTKAVEEVLRVETEAPTRVLEGYRVQEVRVVGVIEGPFEQPVEPTCDRCTPVRAFGLAWPGDDRVVAGQHLTGAGHVPDPLLHARDCPTLAEVPDGDA